MKSKNEPVELANVKLSSIEFGERFRIDYGDLVELAGSIRERGLIQPLAVVRTPDSEFEFKLLAGGRRYKALEIGMHEVVPVRIYPAGIDDLELRAIELSENFHRKNLTWDEEVRLQREIHELQVQIHGPKVSTKQDAPGWGFKDTAELLGAERSTISKDVQLAKAVEAAPELFAGCKSKEDAKKVIKAVGEKALREEMVRRAKAHATPASKRQLLDSYVIGKFEDLANGMDPGTIDFVEFDPPYGIDLQNAKRTDSADSKLEVYGEVPSKEYPAFMQAMLAHTFRIAAPHAWMIVWFAPEPWGESMHNWINESGWKTDRMCGVWIKRSGQSKRPETRLSNQYEMFYVCRKGSPVLVKQGRSNVFDFAPVVAKDKIHPTERPVELITEILNTFCNPGARICVPCLGSGKTLIAANALGMNAVGTDIVKEYKDRFILQVHKMEG